MICLPKMSTSPESSRKETNMSPKLLQSTDSSNNQPTNVAQYYKTAVIGSQNDTVDLTEENAELGTVNSTIPTDNDKVPPAQSPSTLTNSEGKKCEPWTQSATGWNHSSPSTEWNQPHIS